MSLNKVTISGNLTRDPELRQTASAMPVLGFGVAVNDRVKRGDQWEDKPNFLDCKMFGARAESLSRILTKGMKVALVGKLSQSSWEDKDTGKQRSKVEIIVDDVEFMSKGNGSSNNDGGLYQSDIPF